MNQENNGNLPRPNSSHMMQSHQKKNTTWNSWRSKHHHHHYIHNQKNRSQSGDHYSNTSCSSSSSASSTASNSRNNNLKSNQNLRTLTYVTTDFVNSRSPTPSPSSLSPIIQGDKRFSQQQSTASSTSSIHQLETLNVIHQLQSPTSNLTEEGVPLNALVYESDSSHSSFNPNKNVICDGTDYVNSGSGNEFGNVATEITSLVHFPTYSDDDVPENQLHYGSQQNLTYCNTQQQPPPPQPIPNPYPQYTLAGSNSPILYTNTNYGFVEGLNDSSIHKRG